MSKLPITNDTFDEGYAAGRRDQMALCARDQMARCAANGHFQRRAVGHRFSWCFLGPLIVAVLFWLAMVVWVVLR